MSTTSSISQAGNTSRALIIWPDEADLAPVKAAVLSLNLPFRVTPFKMHHEKEGRVLVLAPDFPHIRDHIFPRSEETMKKALQWCLGLIELDRGPRLLKANLDAALGAETVEVEDE